MKNYIIAIILVIIILYFLNKGKENDNYYTEDDKYDNLIPLSYPKSRNNITWGSDIVESSMVELGRFKYPMGLITYGEDENAFMSNCAKNPYVKVDLENKGIEPLTVTLFGDPSQYEDDNTYSWQITTTNVVDKFTLNTSSPISKYVTVEGVGNYLIYIGVTSIICIDRTDANNPTFVWNALSLGNNYQIPIAYHIYSGDIYYCYNEVVVKRNIATGTIVSTTVFSLPIPPLSSVTGIKATANYVFLTRHLESQVWYITQSDWSLGILVSGFNCSAGIGNTSLWYGGLLWREDGGISGVDNDYIYYIKTDTTTNTINCILGFNISDPTLLQSFVSYYEPIDTLFIPSVGSGTGGYRGRLYNNAWYFFGQNEIIGLPTNMFTNLLFLFDTYVSDSYASRGFMRYNAYDGYMYATDGIYLRVYDFDDVNNMSFVDEVQLDANSNYGGVATSFFSFESNYIYVGYVDGSVVRWDADDIQDSSLNVFIKNAGNTVNVPIIMSGTNVYSMRQDGSMLGYEYVVIVTDYSADRLSQSLLDKFNDVASNPIKVCGIKYLCLTDAQLSNPLEFIHTPITGNTSITSLTPLEYKASGQMNKIIYINRFENDLLILDSEHSIRHVINVGEKVTMYFYYVMQVDRGDLEKEEEEIKNNISNIEIELDSCDMVVTLEDYEWYIKNQDKIDDAEAQEVIRRYYEGKNI